MKKKIVKKKKPVKQKIDVVIESLVNLEQKVKELIKKVDQLGSAQYPKTKYPEKQYWGNPIPMKWNPPEYN